MNKIKNRTLSVLLVVGLMLTGLAVYVVRFAISGDKWASFSANAAVFKGGALNVGTLTDRNGVVLAAIEDGNRVFAESADTRRACLHVTGDTTGNIGTGALSVYASELMGYDMISGTYSRTGAGKTVTLTVDSRINAAAYKALGDRRGAVAVMNYKTGEILCMVSTPTYDPQNPPIVEEDDPKYEGVYLNRVLSAAYTPGSTFKLITAAAAIEQIPDVRSRVFECGGKLKLDDGGEITCMRAHGTVTWDDALAVSCNTAFAELSLELGADTLASYADKYGLTGRLDVGKIKTASGGFDKAKPDSTDLAWSGIGQYNDTANPAAMLRFAGAVANGGSAVNMSLVKKTGLFLTQPRPTRVMRKETADILGGMMAYNVSHTYGRDNYPGLQLHAKSGTAEVGGGREPHSWFVGYIDNEGYPLAFVVIAENGGHGSSVAGSVANKVLQAAVS